MHKLDIALPPLRNERLLGVCVRVSESRQALVSNCQTDVASFCRLLFLRFELRISRIFRVRTSIKVIVMFLAMKFVDKMTSCQFGSSKQVLIDRVGARSFNGAKK